jgi:glucosamine--fructose-6-phosphate aminotransferase (isomerizing)
MCGIVGYTGRSLALSPILEGLESLEYRGYDSAGVSLVCNEEIRTFKEVGPVRNVAQTSESDGDAKQSHTGIGHTRWATHGEPSRTNAHPHMNTENTISVVHNGIIENYRELRDMLVNAGYTFSSETDTEVIPHLMDFHYKRLGSVKKAFGKTIEELNGAYAIVVATVYEPDVLYVAKLGSPLAIGVGEDAHYIASDPSAISQHTRKVVFLKDHEVARISPDSLDVYNIEKSRSVEHTAEDLDYDIEQTGLGSYEHYMLKEINDTPETVSSAIRGRVRPASKLVKLGGLDSVAQQLRYIDRIVIVACGTSYYAGLVGEYLIEDIAGIPVEVHLASEFKYRKEPFSRSTALLAISQSGETADTIAAIKKVEGYGVLKLGIVNVVGSTIARMTDAGVYCHAGPELSVASTKAFIAQVTVLTEIALYLSQGRTPDYDTLLKQLTKVPAKIQSVLKQSDSIKSIAEKYAGYRDFLYIGRGYLYPCALEGALKLKEITYIHAEGYAAGEMKHGPLAMIDEQFATLALACDSELLDKTYSNIEEIRARKGPVLAIATEGNDRIRDLADDVIYVPDAPEALQPLVAAVALQLFSYHVAVAKGMDVDRPRNLAKSVTVE